MSTKHTPEPWKISSRTICNIASQDEKLVAEFNFRHDHDKESEGYDERDENALRTAACVNACAGLNPTSIKGAVEALEFCSSLWTDKGLKDGETIRQVFRHEMVNAANKALADLKQPAPQEAAQ